MRKSILLLFSIFGIANCLQAQNLQTEIPCYTDEMLAKRIAEDPSILQRQALHEADLETHTHAANKKAGEGCTVRIIPTVFHIIHNNGSENISDNTVNDYIKKVNETYRFQNVSIDEIDTTWHGVVTDMKVELRLAQLDEKGNPTTGIIRVESTSTTNAGDNVKALSMWNPDKYLNIWVVKSITGSSSTSTVLGYAYFPWMESKTNSGIVIRSDVLNRATLPHELGHYLDLYHPFQDGCGSSCNNSGDRVCDTPPSANQNFGCPKGRNSCNNDSPDLPDQIENIMDYSDCRSFFTKGQKVRVDYTLAKSRTTLVSLSNLFATGVTDSNEVFGEPVAEFTSNTTTACEEGSIIFIDKSCTDAESTDYKWFFPSGVPSAAFVQNPTVTYNKAGVYDVTLIIKNSSGTDTMVRKGLITVMPKVSETKAPFSETFENEDFAESGWDMNSESDLAWQRTTSTAKDGEACLMLNNFSSGKIDETVVVRSPPIDLSTSKSYELNFDLAYARTNAASSERLEIYAVDACRSLNLLRYSATANSLRTVDADVSSNFVPSAADWKSIKVDMNLAKSLTSASIEFRFISFGEQNIYLDNIMVGSWPLSLSNLAFENIKVFPNPTNSEITIEGLSGQKTEITLYDLQGRVVLTENLEKKLDFHLNLQFLENGMYLLEISSETGIYTKRIIKN